MTAPDAYWQEAHAAFHRLASKDAEIWADTEPDVDEPTMLADAAAECDARRADLDAEADLEAGL